LNEGLTAPRRKNQNVKCYIETLDRSFGTIKAVENAHDWNLDVGRLYRAGSLQTVARDVGSIGQI
jgi:hypothetical protein